jgi:carboxypeptidase C (cathepsin A)
VWHFLQAFLSVFPQYNPGVSKTSNITNPTCLNLFTESYGGIMGPVFAKLFEDQNALRENGTLSPSTLEIQLTSLGIINGLVDQKIQMPYYPKFANNNTYGISAIDLTTMYNALSNLSALNGCNDLISTCRLVMDSSDPDGYGDVALVNEACNAAQLSCNLIQNVFLESGLSIYDIRQMSPSPFPSNSYVEYLNNLQVQQSIGSMINYTDSSNAVFDAFIKTGDVIRDDPLLDLVNLLGNGVRVTLLYGDADYICNWMGGEAIAKALAGIADGYSPQFSEAGYAEVVVNSSYVGGAVKQYGNLSFVRIYDAGHQAPAYQPETAFTVFTRTILGTSIATGQTINLSSFRTTGPNQSTKSNKAGPSLNPICWIRLPSETCSNQQLSDMLAGKGVVINDVWYEQSSDFQPPSSTVTAGKPGSTPSTVEGSMVGSSSSTASLTGVYTATATPTPTHNSSSNRSQVRSIYLFMALLSVCEVSSFLM